MPPWPGQTCAQMALWETERERAPSFEVSRTTAKQTMLLIPLLWSETLELSDQDVWGMWVLFLVMLRPLKLRFGRIYAHEEWDLQGNA